MVEPTIVPPRHRYLNNFALHILLSLVNHLSEGCFRQWLRDGFHSNSMAFQVLLGKSTARTRKMGRFSVVCDDHPCFGSSLGLMLFPLYSLLQEREQLATNNEITAA
jgi:hypothetical protein